MKRQSLLLIFLLVVGLCFSTGAAFTQTNSSDTNTMISVVTKSLQHPGWQDAGDIQIYTDEIKRSGDYALLSWTHSHEGGMMVLQRKNNTWEILGSVGGVMDSTSMIEDGVPQEHAQELWRQWGTD